MTQNDPPVSEQYKGAGNGEDLPDYIGVSPPEGKDPEEYDFPERRAEIAQLIMERGSPKRLNYSELGRHYDVHHTTIKRDVDAVAEDVARHLGYQAELKTVAVFERVLDRLLDEDPREAWQTVREFNEWLEDRGALERAPDRVELDASITNAREGDGDYRVLDDDEIDDLIDAKGGVIEAAEGAD